MTSLNSGQTLPERLEYWAKVHPDSDAFVFIDKDGSRTALTCKEIFVHATDFAKHLKGLGLDPGDVICSLLPDSPHGIIAFFGILLAGCVVFNGNLSLKDGSFLIQNLVKTKCRALILSSDVNEERRCIFTKLFEVQDGNKVSSTVLPDLTHVVFPCKNKSLEFLWRNLITESVDDVIRHNPKADAVILLSSGTTGMSKLIVHPGTLFTTLLKGVYGKHTTKMMNYLSLSWMPGLPFFYLSTGQTRVFIDQSKPPQLDGLIQLVYEIIMNERCDIVLIGLPELLDLIKILKTKPDLQNWPLKYCHLGGRPLSKSFVDTVLPYFHSVCNAYGTSETNVVSFVQIGDGREFEDFNAGRPCTGTEVIVKDANNQILAKGKRGNIFVKTNWMFSRYFGDEALTKSEFDENGFINLHDQGYVNENEELIVFGRTAEVIVRGEDYFHPAWIESIIRSCPDVDDVIVVPVPDDILQKEICACIVLIPGSDSDDKKVKEFCQKNFVREDYSSVGACPKYVILLDNIPLNSNSKPDRKAVEKMAVKKLNL
ncbi:hypothetical protein LOTGIDRAFT_162139 [Lottia gigantea]|uniref:AMP-dependent synthetase/ligase domain-containing protein n=1 Tax=Lottia gigantea TaxID=225164 RepID=V3ZP00_LOTGI|nr:hypothetical protein LOTGIDRAFT_162139 [Lottia gigantea]ESO93113.1 hypothetical protein LOTGIDRAFT_162139 [Lottia gigantea]